MSQPVSIFGGRLREERSKLGMSQPAFGELAGVTKKTQMLYEAGVRHPDAVYLAALHRAGVDVMYLLTGDRAAQALTRDEVELLAAFRAAPLAVKAAAIGALQGGSGAAGKNVQKISGPVGQAAAGDFVTQKQEVKNVGAGGKSAGGKRRR